MANIFDQFDAAPASTTGGSANGSHNVFDQFDTPTPAAKPTLQPPRSFARAAGDTALGLGQGVESVGMFVPQLANTLTGGAVDKYLFKPATGAVDKLLGGPDEGRTLAEASQATHNALDDLKSPQLRQKEQELADTKGFLPTVKKVVTDPALLLDQGAQQIPQLVVPGGLVRKAGAVAFERAAGGALARGVEKRVAAGMTEEAATQAAQKTANRVGRTAAIGAGATAAKTTEALMSGSQNSEQAQQEVLGLDQKVLDANPDYQAMIARGVSPKDAREKLAMQAGIRAGAAAAALTYATSGLTGRLESKIFQGETGVAGLGKLLTGTGAKELAKATGKETVQEGLQEGGEQFGQNLGVQSVDPNKSLMDQVPENAALGAVLGGTIGGGAFAGSAAMARPHTAAVPNPGAAPGSLSEAANVLAEPAGPMGRAAQAAQVGGLRPNDAAAEAAGAPALPEQAPETAQPVAAAPTDAPAAPPAAVEQTPAAPLPWVNLQTGEVGKPTKGQLTKALADHIVQTFDTQGHMRINADDLAAQWGVTKKMINQVRPAAQDSANNRVRASQNSALNEPSGDTGQLPGAVDEVAAPSETVNPVSEQNQQPAEISGQATTGATDGVAGTDTTGDANAAVAPAAAAGETSQPDKEPSSAEKPDNVPSQPAAQGNGVDSAAGRAGGEGQGGTASEAEARVPGEAPQEEAAPPRARVPAPEAAQPAPAVATTKTPPTGGVSASGGGKVSNGFTVSAAAKAAERVRLKTPDGEVNGRVRVDRLLAKGYTKVESVPSGNRMRHQMVRSNGAFQPIPAAALDYAKEAVARAADSTPAAKAPVKESLTAGQKRTSELLGAGVGDTVRTTGMGAEIQPGSTWKIERIDKDGTVHTSSPGGGTGTWKRSDLEREVKKGARFAKEANAASVVDVAAVESAAHPENEKPDPTPAQQEAGNHSMGHVRLHGLDISIEIPKGGTRRGIDRNGKPWERVLSEHYGRILRTIGADGEQVDVYLGPHAEDAGKPVFVIDQVKPGTKVYDESKVMLGYATGAGARRAYDSNFPRNVKTFGGIRKMSLDEFKAWLKDGDTTKPAATAPAVNQSLTAEPAEQATTEKSSPVAAKPTAKRGGIATNGAKVRVAGGKLQYVPRARETLEAYFKPGDVVPSYGGQDRVISTDFSDESNPQIRVISVDKDGNVKPNERERVHGTMPTERELVAKLGKPVLAGKVAPTKQTAPVAAVADETADTAAAPAVSKTETTADSGEELWANRRNSTGKGIEWSDIAELNDTLKAREAVKSKVWPRPDYATLVEGGMPAPIAHIIKQVYDAIATKPETRGAPTDAEYRDYITGVQKVRDAAFAWAKQVMEQPEIGGLEAKLRGAASTFHASAVMESFLGLGKRGNAPMMDSLFPHPQGATMYNSGRFGHGEQGKENNRLALLLGGNKLARAMQPGSKAASAAMKSIANGWPAAREAWEQRGYKAVPVGKGTIREATGIRGNGEKVTMYRPSFENTPIRTSSFADRAEAQAFLDQAKPWALLNKDGRVVSWHATEDETTTAARATTSSKTGGDGAKAEAPVELQNARTGPERRAANEDVTSGQLRETFGFKGINFGNWMKGDGGKNAAERQAHLNHAYDAFHDLAEIMGLPPKAMSLNGTLGLAIGAQGTGGKKAAAAHFVPGVNEINLTREQGAGSLAHEWAHALDHYFAAQAGGRVVASKDPFLTEHLANPGDGVRPEVRRAFKTIVEAMETRPETEAEQAARLNAYQKTGRDGVESVLRTARQAIEQNGKGDKAAALEQFDAMAQRLRTGDVGEGYIKTGKGQMDAAPQVVGQVANLVKETTGRKPDWTQQLSSYARMVSGVVAAKSDNAQRAQRVTSDFAHEARKLEGSRTKPYWSTKLEMFARAFQSYVLDKLAVEGNRNSYLTRSQMDPATLKVAQDMGVGEAGDRYPRGAERAAIDKAFDALVGELKTREGENGNAVLFRQTNDATNTVAPVTAAQEAHTARIKQIATAAMGKWKGDDVPNLRVVATPEQLPAAAKVAANGLASNAYKTAAGMYDGRTIWIVASAHKTDQAGVRRILTTMAHEGVGHYGVERIVERELGTGAWTKIETATERLRNNPELASPAIRAVLDDVGKRYRGADAPTYAREFLAVSAERGVRNGLLDRAITAIRQWLRRVMPDLRLSEHELRQLLVQSDQYLRMGESQQQRVQSRAAMAFSRGVDAMLDTPAFKRWFGESKVADPAGNPLPVFHGTADDFNAFDPNRSGSATAHMTATLGSFFAEDRAKAQHYAENASQGVPAEERVIDAYLSIQKPYEMGLKEFQALDSQAESTALREKLQAQGYDGIHLKDVGQWVAFTPTQIKSASENRGTFDPGNPNIFFSRSAESVDTLDGGQQTQQETLVQRAKDWVAGKFEDLLPSALSLLQRRHLTELMAGQAPLRAATQYDEMVQQLDADRAQLLSGAPDAAEHPSNMLKAGAAVVAQELREFTHEKGVAGWFGRKTAQGRQLAEVMHESTIKSIDPSKAYQRLQMKSARGEWVDWTPQLVKERIAMLKDQMMGRSADDKTAMMDEIRSLRSLKSREKQRQQAYPQMVAKYQALPPAGKALYQKMRDWYEQMSDATADALEARIMALRGDMEESQGQEVAERQTRMLVQKLRAEFEENKVTGVYFPLTRNGDYWVSYKDRAGDQGFQRFETASAQKKWLKELSQKSGAVLATGRMDGNLRAKDAPSGTFIADVIATMKKSGAPEKVQDEVYQTFLRTLPEVSMRKHAIHRKATPGFSDDITRGFAQNAYHGAHQLARLRWAHRLQTQVDNMQKNMDAARKLPGADPAKIARADALLGELKRRHDAIMSPNDTQVANTLNGIGFLYYMGASPASALVNLTQNAQVTLPVLGAHHGWGKASRMLGAAMRDSMRTGGNIQRTLTDEEELRAYNALRARGDIDKTQAHTMAGLAEGSLLQANPVYAKVMNGLTWMFHQAEVVNREAAGMASYRLARSRGDDFNAAVQYASDIINGTHFDYSAANRPRIMQGNTARVALQFKNYSASMTWMLYRNLYQSFKGESPEVRSVARKTLTGILGMTSLFAGVMGLPIINVVRAVAGAAHAAGGDDDEPWDFNTEFRKWLAEHLGDDVANWVADGAVSQVTGANIASRVGMADLWFHDEDRALEGKDAFYNYLEGVAGPMAGLAKNIFIGTDMISKGHTWRGFETMMPKFAKDAMKATRFAHEGVNSLRGDPIMSDVSAAQELIQGLGFQPTALREQQRINSALMNYTQVVRDRRIMLLNAYAMAWKEGDTAAVSKTTDKISAFNNHWPEIAIKPGTIRDSLRQRAKLSARAENGIMLDRRIGARIKQEVGATAQPVE